MTVISVAALMVLALPAGAITDGTVDQEDDFPFVTVVVDFQSGYLCSAGAVDSMHLITAAHCFQPALPPDLGGPPNVPVHGVVVFYGVDPLFGPADAVMTGTWYPDAWCPGCGPGLPGFDSKDLAVIKLDAPIVLDEYLVLPDLGQSDTLRNKTAVMTAGYGVNDFIPGGGPLTENAAFDGQRRFAPADLIASNHKHSGEYLKVSSNPSKGKGGTCFGDSGGPLMHDDGDGWVILANTSYGTNGVCAGVGYFNRVDTVEALSFIESIRNLSP
jgi:hypothetical protein